MNKQELIEKYEYLSHDCFRRVDTSEVLRDLKQLDEPQEVEIPMFVADWIEKCKSEKRRLHESLTYTPFGVNGWVSNPKNQEIFARAWLDGYEVEKEKRYLVKMKGIDTNFNFLNRHRNENYWIFSNKEENTLYQTHHTRKELEQSGFGWVFDCPGIEIEEVQDDSKV